MPEAATTAGAAAEQAVVKAAAAASDLEQAAAEAATAELTAMQEAAGTAQADVVFDPAAPGPEAPMAGSGAEVVDAEKELQDLDQALAANVKAVDVDLASVAQSSGDSPAVDFTAQQIQPAVGEEAPPMPSATDALRASSIHVDEAFGGAPQPSDASAPAAEAPTQTSAPAASAATPAKAAPAAVTDKAVSAWQRLNGKMPRQVPALAVGLLVLVNYPLRWLPPKASRIVDWVAISLLAWVPIVWVLGSMYTPGPPTVSAPAGETAGAEHAEGHEAAPTASDGHGDSGPADHGGH